MQTSIPAVGHRAEPGLQPGEHERGKPTILCTKRENHQALKAAWTAAPASLPEPKFSMLALHPTATKPDGTDWKAMPGSTPQSP